MKKSHEKGFAERRQTAMDAKKALLEKFKAGTDPNDPEVAARREERRRIIEAREKREAEKEAERKAKLEEEARIRAEKKAAEEAARLAREEAERKAAEEAERLAREKAEEQRLAQEAKRKNSQADVIARMLAEDAERMAGWKVKVRNR